MSQDKRVGSGLNLGLQIGTQFCPGLSRPSSATRNEGDIDRKQIEFFLWPEPRRRVYPEEVRGWFFDIYIQGSKYNFKS
jgi:hypothetical protein